MNNSAASNVGDSTDFETLLSDAISNVETIRHLQCTHKNGAKRKKGSRGPQAKVVKLKLYHLPEASALPNFGITTRGLVKQHMDQGFGFPHQCFNALTNRSKAMSISIHLSAEQVTETVYDMCPRLGRRPFHLYKMDKRKTLQIVERRDARSLWELHFQGVFIVQQSFDAGGGDTVLQLLNQSPEHNSVLDSQDDFNPDFLEHSLHNIPLNADSLTSTTVATTSAIDQENTLDVQESTSRQLAATSASVTLPGSTSLSPPFAHSNLTVTTVTHNHHVPFPTQMIELTIISSSKTMKYRFTNDCKPSDVYTTVASQESLGNDFLLVDTGNRDYFLARHSNCTLKQWGIRSGRIFLVEEDVDKYIGGTNVPDDAETTNDDPDITIRLGINEQELHIRRIQLYTSLSGTQQVLLRRQHLVNDAFEQYQDTSILSQKIFVQFEGENGDDLEGLTREFFSQFWLEWTKLFSGNDSIYMTVDAQNVIPDKHLNAAGRILLHGYILCGYLPYYINACVLFWLLTGAEPSEKFLLEEFCRSFDDGDRNAVNSALQMEVLTDNAQAHLAGLLCQHDMGIVPSRENLEEALRNLSRYVVLVKPFRYLHGLRQPIADIANRLFGHINEDEFKALLTRMLPTGVQVVEKLQIKYTNDEDGTKQALEERVADFLQTYLVSLGQKTLVVFLRFVSGCEILPARITVEFNSEMREEFMIPSAHTCSVSLHLSRYFLTYPKFYSVMDRLLANPQLWTRFDIV